MTAKKTAPKACAVDATKASISTTPEDRKPVDNEAQPIEQPTKPIVDVNVADSKLTNDAFSVYDAVDVDSLQDAAIDAFRTGEKSSRREGQMQIANILARYHQDKFRGDALPTKLYKDDGKLNVVCVQLIARLIYAVPEKTMDGAKNPLPRNLEMRVRNIAPIIWYAIQERIPLVWNDDEDALMVPTWYATTDSTMVEAFDKSPETRIPFNKPVALDGREGRTVAALLKRTIDPSKVASKRAANSDTRSNAQKHDDAFKAAVGNSGLAKTLALVADMMTKGEKAFADEVVELVGLCAEHVIARNGPAALGKAISGLAAPSKKTAA